MIQVKIVDPSSCSLIQYMRLPRINRRPYSECAACVKCEEHIWRITGIRGRMSDGSQFDILGLLPLHPHDCSAM